MKSDAPKHEILISDKQIQQRIVELGEEISKEYQGKIPIFIGILNGSFIFLADLIRKISIDCEVDFIKLSSYGDSKISSGNVTMLKDFDCQVEGRDIIVVEDIVDSGLSLQYLRQKLLTMKPRSLKFVSLLLKP
jgi:hypoxanthine phosphoribosyltransferase